VQLVLFVCLVSLGSVLAQEADVQPEGLRPDAPTFALHGPFSVGTMELTIEDGDRVLPVTVWYPVDVGEPEGPYTYAIEAPPVTFEGHAIQDANIFIGAVPYPLVVFSHGAGGSRYNSLYLVEHLASYGFVVMAPDHVGDTMINSEDENVFVRSHVSRPRDITLVINRAEAANAAGGEFENLIDTERVAVVGHSSGAWTAFLAAGAQRDYRALQTWCADNPDDYFTCATLMGQEQLLVDLLGLEEIPEGLWPAVGDARVDAIVAMAPGNVPAFGAEGLASISVPTMIMMGSGDMFLPYDSFGPPAYEAVSSDQKAFVTFEDGNHMIFGNACAACSWMIDFGYYNFCSDAVWDMDRVHDLINYFVTSFLLDTLKDDEDAHLALVPDNVAFPGVTYQATMK
ncbi:MAG: dienelactone hydrolase family protein, partial [Anaerolineae bacterium]|nr:dienelactone hydrolase family protein [Anaerolineae bacterium]